LKTRKKQEKIRHKSPYKDGLGMEFTARASWCQRERWHTVYNAYRYFARHKL